MNTLNQKIDDFRHTEDGKIIQGSAHTCQVINHKNRNKIVIKAVCDLRKIQNSFDSIVCCGVSGLLVAPQVAEIINKNLVIVRKPDEKRYSKFFMEGAAPYLYVILDDLLCSGDTLKWIRNTIYEDCPKAKCVGLYCYLPEECSYDISTEKLFYERYRTKLLNPAPPRK